MRSSILLLPLFAIGGCVAPSVGPEPSLAPRAAEAIDPRVPVPNVTPQGPADAVLAARLSGLVNQAEAGRATFQARREDAARLSAGAGAQASESWIAAQQAVARMVAQSGVATRAAGDIDALASARLQERHYITPADQEAIAAAALAVGRISEAQRSAIDQLNAKLAR